MRINRKNYEIYFLDWHEGNLEASMEADLFLFLEQNPDLKIEFDEFENFQLAPDHNITFEDKEDFKKNPVISVGEINASNYNEFFVAGIEGDLKGQELSLLNRFLGRNPALATEFTLLSKTVLVPDTNIVFEEKSSLKKSVFAIYFQKNWIYYASGIAATLLILIWVSFSGNKTPEQRFVENTPSVETVVPENQIADADVPDEEITESIEALPAQAESMVEITQDSENVQTEITTVFESQELASVEDPALPVEVSDPRSEIQVMQGIHETTTFNIVFADNFKQRNIPLQEKDTYSQLFEYIATANDYKLASNESPVPEAEPIVSSPRLNRFKNIFKRKIPVKKRDKSRINFWTFADIGVQGFNAVTNKDVSINRIKDDEGNVVAYALQNEEGQISRIKRRKAEEDQQAVQ